LQVGQILLQHLQGTERVRVVHHDVGRSSFTKYSIPRRRTDPVPPSRSRRYILGSDPTSPLCTGSGIPSRLSLPDRTSSTEPDDIGLHIAERLITASFFLVSGLGSGAHSKKLLAGTRHRFSGLSQARGCGDEVLRMLVTGGPPNFGGGGIPQRVVVSSIPCSGCGIVRKH
jgi:hypothetical protein